MTPSLRHGSTVAWAKYPETPKDFKSTDPSNGYPRLFRRNRGLCPETLKPFNYGMLIKDSHDNLRNMWLGPKYSVGLRLIRSLCRALERVCVQKLLGPFRASFKPMKPRSPPKT